MPAEEARSLTSPSLAPRIVLVAGEASGDLHGADFLRELQGVVPDVQAVGIGGDHLRALGMHTIADAGAVATVGLGEGVAHLRALWRTFRQLGRILREEQPALCVLIDFPEFNLRLARVAKRAGVPVLYYIGPQVWAWRRGRVRTVARWVDRLAVVFPFEPELYTPWLPSVEYVGHPLLDRVTATRGREDTLRLHGLDPERQTVLLLPGSRAKEIDHHLTAMTRACAMLGRNGRRQFVLALAPTVARAHVEARMRDGGLRIPIVTGDSYNLMAAADLAFVASGTATLECALLECPMVIAYRVPRTTYALARMLVHGVRHVGMPNIVAGREIVPELLQGGVDPERLAAEAERILDEPVRRQRMIEDLRNVRSLLGRGGAAHRAAAMAAEMMRTGA